MVACSKIVLVGLIIGAVTFTSGDERNLQTKGETRRLNGAFIRRRRPATSDEGGKTPPYAVSMEPLIKYSQRDPLYDKLNRNKSTTQDISSRGDYLSAGSNNLAEVTAGPRLDQYGPPQYGPPQYGPPQYGPPPQYYQEPEPIIEIIIKESNESLPAPTQAPTLPPPPATREPVQVFYVKYQKNPNGGGYGESDVIYEPPVPALTQHESDAVEPDPDPQYPPFQQEASTEPPSYLPPPPSTTLRTIIRPESETYHVPEGGSSGLKVTFSSSSDHVERNEHELAESASEVEGRLPERQQRYQSQNVESIDITTAKPHYFKRQQGPYFPPPQNPPNLHEFTPPPPGQFQNGPPQGRQPYPSHTTQAIYNQGNQQPQFRPQQQAAATFQRPQQFNPNQNSVNQPPNFQQRQPARYNEPLRQQGPNPNDYRARPPQQQNFEPQRRPQFQPTLEAQIEEYQRHKLFLHQQNLRQQAEQANQAQQQNFNRNPPQPIQNQNIQYQPLQPIHVQSQPQGIPFQRGPPNFRQQYSSHQSREPVQNKVISQNLVTPQPVNTAAPFTPSNPVVVPENSKPFVPSPQHNPPQNQQAFIQPSQASFTKPEVQTSNPGIDYSGRNTGFSRPQPIYNDAEFVKTISPIEDIDIKSDGESGNKVPGDEQEKGPTESSQELSTQDRAHLALSALANHKIAPQAENHRYEHSSTTPSPQPTFYSTTSPPNTSPNNIYSNQPSSTQAPNSYEEEKKEEETAEEVQKKKANLAALPDEVPDDLREQLLSSGILGNADIQILDYDKVGDIPIENLPPEALENLYGAGSEQVATVVKPDGTPDKKSVEMKVVRFDPNTKEGQGLADTYLREDATQLDPVVLNDSRYNRYLPLKISGTNFPLPDIPQLKNRIVNSVVVLAPVDYDFIKTTQDDVDRASRTIQVEGVRFIAGESLKTLVKDPSLTNYNKWLEAEKDTPSKRQSVVLLVTSPTSTEKSPKSSKMEIFMYDVATAKVSKLRGELSSTFVEVAESNSGSEELEELAGASSEETSPSTR